MINKRRYPAYSHWSIMKVRHQPLPSSTIDRSHPFTIAMVHHSPAPAWTATPWHPGTRESWHRCPFRWGGPAACHLGPGHWPFRGSWRCQELLGVTTRTGGESWIMIQSYNMWVNQFANHDAGEDPNYFGYIRDVTNQECRVWKPIATWIIS